MKRNKKGQFKPKLSALQMLTFTLLGIVLCYFSGLYMDNVKLKADLNYQTAYSKHIETKGLEHWNKMYDFSQHRYDQPKDIKEMIHFLFQENADNAIEVFTCESGLNPKAINKNTNGTIDVGVAQINSVHGVSERYLKNAWVNLTVAKSIFDAQGWTPWVCANKMGIR